MRKICAFCDEDILDGEVVNFIGESKFKLIPSKINFALSRDMKVDDLYHLECMDYMLGGGQ